MPSEMAKPHMGTGDMARACLVLLVAALSGLAIRPALAQSQSSTQVSPQVHAEQVWQAEDACVAKSTTSFPDQDLTSLRRRDRFVDACLKAQDLPPRAHLVPDE